MAAGNQAAGEPLLLTYEQACEKLGVTRSQLYRMMHRGEIKPLKLGPQVRRISLAELEAYVARLEAEQHSDRPAA